MKNILLNEKIDSLCNKIIADLGCCVGGKNIFVLGIDGPTAAGKSLFAENLSSIYSKISGKKAFIYQFDWTLADRSARHKDQDVLFNKDYIKRFELEAELHMRLKEAESFLKELYLFNILNLKNNSQSNFSINLKNLYSREDGGRLTGEKNLFLEPGSLVILEGHYTLRSEFDKYVDTNILLLGHKGTLLGRKISRVSGYRGAQEAEEYFHTIDAPSFESHLQRFGQNAKFIIQNDDYANPFLIHEGFISEWIEQGLPCDKFIHKTANHYLNSLDFITDFFSNSFMLPQHIPNFAKILFSKLHELDLKIADKIISSVDSQSVSLTQVINNFVSDCNEESSEPNRKLKLRFTNALFNVYFRVFPVSFGVSLDGDENFIMLFDFFEEKIQVCIAWKGGVRFLSCNRSLGIDLSGKLANWKVEKPNFSYEKSVRTLLLTPTNFTIPPIFNDSNSEIHFTGKEHLNISPSESFKKLFNGNTCWIARLALQDEVVFFSELCALLGAQTITVGNYLIAFISSNKKLIEEFRIFRDEWELDCQDVEYRNKDILLHDQIVINERAELDLIASLDNPHFLVLDTHLFLKQGQLTDNKIDSVLKNLTLFLNSQNRLLRKRTIQFIERQFGGINLQVKNIWPEYSDSEATITLDYLCSMQPSIMAEIYLWLSIKKSSSAILGANVYDISKMSLDGLGHLQAAIKEKCPIVLQASLNALGQDEGHGAGYLKPSKGAQDLIDSILASLRFLFLKNQLEAPLFGIGIDHVDSRNDNPPGRARRFLSNSFKTGLITHVVLDGSSLFDADNSGPSLISAYEKVANYASNLVEGMENSILIDKEICGGELNYIGANRLANIPDSKEIEVFVGIVKKYFRSKNLGGFLRRPMLFIGNVGTTHHSGDVGIVNPEITATWIDAVKKDLFVSAVLHGTTGTSSNVLKRATSGCKKINIAGDFLKTYIDALPDQIKEMILNERRGEPKRALASVRSAIQNLSEFEKNSISESIFEHSRSMMRTINSPKLTTSDINFFRYSPFKFTDLEIKEIINQIKSKHSFFNLDSVSDKTVALKGTFCASLIEIPYGQEFVEIAKELISLGVNNFHIDVGDGEFISRQFSGLLKLKKLKELNPKIEANVHFMVKDSHLKGEDNLVETYIESYAKSGCSRIGIHINSVSNLDQVYKCFDQIRLNGSNPGLVLEVDEPFNSTLREVILEQNISWIVLMGVRVGFGGQLFNTAALQKIQSIRNFSNEFKKNILIEIDGGLSFDNLHACLFAGANNFAGWSIIKSDMQFTMREKLERVNNLLSGNFSNQKYS